MVDLIKKGDSSTPELTKDVADKIFDLIVEYGNADLAVKGQSHSEYEPEHFNLVDKEIDKVYEEITSKLSGSFLIKAAVPAEYDELGEEITEAVSAEYFKVTTESKFKESLSSDLLNTDKVYALFKGSNSWTELKTKYVVE